MSAGVILVSTDKDLESTLTRALAGTRAKLMGTVGEVKGVIEIMREHPVKLILVDLFLPGTSGLDALKSLKKMDETLSVGLFSRMRGRGFLERAFRYGASDVLVYPVSQQAIRDTILHRLDRIDDQALITFQQQQEEEEES